MGVEIGPQPHAVAVDEEVRFVPPHVVAKPLFGGETGRADIDTWLRLVSARIFPHEPALGQDLSVELNYVDAAHATLQGWSINGVSESEGSGSN